MANITPTTAAKYIKEVWTKDIQKPFYSQLYFADLVTRWDSLVSDGGNKINYPTLSKKTARDKTPGSDVTYDADTESEVELNIDKHKYYAFVVEDIVKLQQNYPVSQIYKDAGEEAVRRSIDTSIGALHASAGTNVSGGATVDDADMLAVVLALDLADTPPTGRSGVIHPKVMGDFRAINKYSAYDQTSKPGMAVSGRPYLGTVYGMDLYMSTNVADDTTNTHNLFFHKSALALAMQQKPKFEAEYSVDKLGWKIACHAVYGVGVIRAAALVDLERAS